MHHYDKYKDFPISRTLSVNKVILERVGVSALYVRNAEMNPEPLSQSQGILVQCHA